RAGIPQGAERALALAYADPQVVGARDGLGIGLPFDGDDEGAAAALAARFDEPARERAGAGDDPERTGHQSSSGRRIGREVSARRKLTKASMVPRPPYFAATASTRSAK